VLSDTICLDITRFDARQRVLLSDLSLFQFRIKSPGVRCAEMQWLTLEGRGLSNLAAASCFQIAKRIAVLRINKRTEQVLQKSPSELPYVQWIMAWLARYASYITIDLVKFLEGLLPLLVPPPSKRNRMASSTSGSQRSTKASGFFGMLHSLEFDYLIAVLNGERAYLRGQMDEELSDFELLANAIIESSASAHSLLQEVITAGLDCLKNPQPEFRNETAFTRSWHLFACDFGKVCRCYMQMNALDSYSLRQKFHNALQFVIQKADEVDRNHHHSSAAARSNRFAFHGLELCHWACVYGIYFDIEAYLPTLLRRNKQASQTSKRFIAQWLLKTENASPRAPGQILLAEFPKVLDEVLEWIQH
jgi:hypothetical protein